MWCIYDSSRFFHSIPSPLRFTPTRLDSMMLACSDGACYMLMCCFHYFSLAPPRRRFIIVSDSLVNVFLPSLESNFFCFSHRRAKSNVSRSDESASASTTKHWRDVDVMNEWKKSGIFKWTGNSYNLIKLNFSLTSLINVNQELKCFAKQSAKIFRSPLAPFDLLLLLCQFWRLFEKTKKNANLKREETLISCFDGYTKEFNSAMWRKFLHTITARSLCKSIEETSRLLARQWISSTSLKRFAIAIDVQQCQATTENWIRAES